MGPTAFQDLADHHPVLKAKQEHLGREAGPQPATVDSLHNPPQCPRTGWAIATVLSLGKITNSRGVPQRASRPRREGPCGNRQCADAGFPCPHSARSGQVVETPSQTRARQRPATTLIPVLQRPICERAKKPRRHRDGAATAGVKEQRSHSSTSLNASVRADTAIVAATRGKSTTLAARRALVNGRRMGLSRHAFTLVYPSQSPRAYVRMAAGGW